MARPAPETYPIVTSTAPALQAAYPVETAKVSVPAPAPRRMESPSAPAARQPSLFAAEPAPRASRVIRFEEIAPPGHLLPPPKKRRPGSGPKPSSPEPAEFQQRLDFQTVSSQTHSRTHSDTATMYGGNPVAGPIHRLCAAVADYSLITVALVLFFAPFYLAGGDIVLNRLTTPLFCAVPLLITFFYRSLYCLCRGDSSGLQWLGLRLVHVDGKTPTRGQRGVRVFAGCLSLVAGGLGLVWALTDEEQLAWHDHISRTFPTPEYTRDASLTRKR